MVNGWLCRKCEHAKMSGLMVKLNPTGKARLILNLSAQKGSCVNEGIDRTAWWKPEGLEETHGEL
jgi:hypothetical protein